MTAQSPKPSCHDVITGRWNPSDVDRAAGRLPGFGSVTNIINGGLECGRERHWKTKIQSSDARKPGHLLQGFRAFSVLSLGRTFMRDSAAAPVSAIAVAYSENLPQLQRLWYRQDPLSYNPFRLRSFLELLETELLAMAAHGVVVAAFLLCCLAGSCYGNVLFSSLKRTLDVTASPIQGQVLKAGEDKITVTWALNQSLPAGTDSAYKTVKVKLCYAPISQKDHAWRKTEGNLSKHKTCQHNVVARPYDSSNKTVQGFEWTIERDMSQPRTSYAPTHTTPTATFPCLPPAILLRPETSDSASVFTITSMATFSLILSV